MYVVDWLSGWSPERSRGVTWFDGHGGVSEFHGTGPRSWSKVFISHDARWTFFPLQFHADRTSASDEKQLMESF